MEPTRVSDVFAVVAFLALTLAVVARFQGYLVSGDWWMIPAALVVGWLAADFVSGFVHWLGDTWGSVDMPVLGKRFIHPFRDHHVDPKGITRHDFWRTNANNCLVSLPVLLLMLVLPLGLESPLLLFLGYSFLSMIFWVFLTNQIHKWSHMATPPPVVRPLQRMGVFLNTDHHDVHHAAPYSANYCITSGALNPVLEHLQFFRRLERLVTRVTGLTPRRDEMNDPA